MKQPQIPEVQSIKRDKQREEDLKRTRMLLNAETISLSTGLLIIIVVFGAHCSSLSSIHATYDNTTSPGYLHIKSKMVHVCNESSALRVETSGCLPCQVKYLILKSVKSIHNHSKDTIRLLKSHTGEQVPTHCNASNSEFSTLDKIIFHNRQLSEPRYLAMLLMTHLYTMGDVMDLIHNDAVTFNEHHGESEENKLRLINHLNDTSSLTYMLPYLASFGDCGDSPLDSPLKSSLPLPLDLQHTAQSRNTMLAYCSTCELCQVAKLFYKHLGGLEEEEMHCHCHYDSGIQKRQDHSGNFRRVTK